MWFVGAFDSRQGRKVALGPTPPPNSPARGKVTGNPPRRPFGSVTASGAGWGVPGASEVGQAQGGRLFNNGTETWT